MSDPKWLIVTLGGEGGWRYGRSGRHEKVPPGAIATIGIPITGDIERQLAALGYTRLPPSEEER